MGTFKEIISEKVKIQTASVDKQWDSLSLKAKDGTSIEFGIPEDGDFSPFIKIGSKEYEIDGSDFSVISKFIQKKSLRIV